MATRYKIIFGLFSVFFIGLLLGITALISVNKISEVTNKQVGLHTAATEVSTILNAHYIWRQSLTEAVLNMGNFTGSVNPEECALGKWRQSEAAGAISDTTVLQILNDIDTPHRYIHLEAQNVLNMISEGEQASAVRILNENILPRTQEVISLLIQLESRYNAIADDASTELVQLNRTIMLIIIATIVLAFLISVLLGYKITKSIMTPIRQLEEAAKHIAVGDLDISVEYSVDDEIGRLAKAFRNMTDSVRTQVAAAQQLADGDLTVSLNPRSDKDTMNIAMSRMITSLSRMFSEISTSTSQVSSGSRQIANGAQALAQGTTEQAAAVQQLSASISDLASQTKANADMASRAASLAAIIKQSAEKGSLQMDNMMDAVREINSASQSINKVIKVIDDIAFQTNILSLNAAVEAARAGQHGKGFSVVAEEVRSLASKSAEAAKNSAQLIADSIQKAELGARIAADTSASFIDIVSGINESSLLVSDIANSSHTQSVGISQINRGIDQVALVVQQNSANAQQSAATSQQLSSQAALLQDLLSQFKLINSHSHLSLPSGGQITEDR